MINCSPRITLPNSLNSSFVNAKLRIDRVRAARYSICACSIDQIIHHYSLSYKSNATPDHLQTAVFEFFLFKHQSADSYCIYYNVSCWLWASHIKMSLGQSKSSLSSLNQEHNMSLFGALSFDAIKWSQRKFDGYCSSESQFSARAHAYRRVHYAMGSVALVTKRLIIGIDRSISFFFLANQPNHQEREREWERTKYSLGWITCCS